MKEYIEREAANEACREAVRRYPNSFYNGIEAARDAIRKLPAADVRPVVLCRDCYAYRCYKELAEAAYLDPQMYCGLLRCEMGEDSFCSYGKRKEET
jgi:hypothetical protein